MRASLLVAALTACAAAGPAPRIDASPDGGRAAGDLTDGGLADTGALRDSGQRVDASPLDAEVDVSPSPDGAPSGVDAGLMPDAAHEATPDFACGTDSPASSLVDVGRVRLYVECQGSGPTLILLHGYPESHLAWRKLWAPLIARGYRLVAPDLRGANRSDKPSGVESYRIDELVADVEGLIEATRASRVAIIGHDWGGTIAWIYAHRHPERTRGLLIMAGPHPDIWGRAEIDPVQAEAGNAYVPLLASPLGEAAFLVFPAMLDPHLDDAELSLYQEAWNQPDSARSMNDWYRANLHPEVRLPEGVYVEVPSLVLWGTNDAFTTPSQLEHLPRFVREVEIVRWEGADHFLTHQRTDEVVTRWADFEAELGR